MGKNACMAPEEPTPDVLTSLPRTRPQRRSAKRDAVRKPPAKKAAAKAAKKAAPAKKAPAKPRKAAPKATAAPRPKVAAQQIPPAGYAAPRQDESGAPSGVELVGTAIQAAGELAQIGAAVGKQALKGVLGRLGR